jgi:hypothetical protein
VAVTTPTAVPPPAPAPTKPLTLEQEAAARAVVDQKLYEITGVRPGTVTPAPGRPSAPAQANITLAPPPTAPVNSTVATPVVNVRAHRLAALLEAYRADRITPIEYHNQRAKILAETQP